MEIDTIDIDLGKTAFHLVGVNVRGEGVVCRRCSRTQLLCLMSNPQAGHTSGIPFGGAGQKSRLFSAHDRKGWGPTHGNPLRKEGNYDERSL
jgi:hypothetical protein